MEQLKIFSPLPTDYCSYSPCKRDYVLVHNENKTWSDAQAYCREKYTDLATINNAQDMNRVLEITGNRFNDFWIGLYKDVLTWRQLQPDHDYLGDVGKDLTSIQRCGGIKHTGPSWNLDCDLLNYFFCFDGNINSEIVFMHIDNARNMTSSLVAT